MLTLLFKVIHCNFAVISNHLSNDVEVNIATLIQQAESSMINEVIILFHQKLQKNC